MGFSRQEYWSGLPFPTTGDLPDPGKEPAFLASPESPAFAGRFFTTSVTWEAHFDNIHQLMRKMENFFKNNISLNLVLS